MTTVVFIPSDGLDTRRSDVMHKHCHKTDSPAQSYSAKSLSNSELGVAAGATDQVHKAKANSQAGIRVHAHQKWDATGRPIGDGVNSSLEEEQECLQNRLEEWDECCLVFYAVLVFQISHNSAAKPLLMSPAASGKS
jgi:hypothetical protein